MAELADAYVEGRMEKSVWVQVPFFTPNSKTTIYSMFLRL